MTTTGTPRDAAFMFASTGDWARAVPAARESLATDPHDASALALLALGLSHLNEPAQAVEIGRRAVGVDPELAFAHYALGHALLTHDDPAAAERAAREALRIDPDSDGYSLLGSAFARQRRWREVLKAAEQGLELDAEHTGCANLRAMALGHLGRAQEADRVARKTLADDPDNASSHVNHGWLLLRQSKYVEALDSFRTALRLDATLDSARAGIVEALKARSVFYRIVLRYSLWIGSLDARSRWLMIVGLVVGSRFARGLLRENPAWWPILGPALAVYTLFAVSTWLAEPFSNLLLRLNPFGRLALSKAETMASNLVGGCLGGAVVSGLLFALTATTGWLVVAVVCVVMLVPISGTFSGYGTRAWRPLLIVLIVLAGFGAAGAVLSFVSLDLAVFPLIALVLGAVLFGWVANYFLIKFG